MGHNQNNTGRPPRPIHDRFWEKVEKRGKLCWLWRSHSFRDGYGCFNIKQKFWKAHRVSWTLVNGTIPKGMMVLHKCDIRNCVNPNHLYLGVQKDNMRDRAVRGRTARVLCHPSTTKICWNDVLSIRKEYDRGAISQERLGNKYGVSQSQVGRIVRFQRRRGA